MSTTIPSSLQQLKAEFDPWQQTKPIPQSRIRLVLGQRAAALRAQYSDRDITRLLSITEARLLKRVGEAFSHQAAAAAAASPKGCISAALPPAPDAQVSNAKKLLTVVQRLLNVERPRPKEKPVVTMRCHQCQGLMKVTGLSPARASPH